MKKLDEHHSVGRSRKNIVFDVDGVRLPYRIRVNTLWSPIMGWGGLKIQQVATKTYEFRTPNQWNNRAAFLDEMKERYPVFFEYLLFNLDKF